MSFFSIVSNASQQQFSLRPQTNGSGLQTSVRSAETLLDQIGNTASPLTEEEQKAAQGLLQDFKDAVETNISMSRALQDNKDALREERLARIEARIEQLKELLRFATPEQAKRLLKELKQISKEFSSAANGLKKAAGELGGGSGSSLSATANAVSSVISSTLGSASQPPTVSNLGAVGSSAAQVATAKHLSEPAVSNPDTGTPSEYTGIKDGTATGRGSKTRVEQTEALKSGVFAYAEQQAKSETAHKDSRIAGMRDEQDRLRKVGDDIEMLAKWLGALAEKDDETEDDLDDIRDELKAGRDDLNDPELVETLRPKTTKFGTSASQFQETAATGSSIDVTTPVVQTDIVV
ncbi:MULTISPECIES: hypothetical protein [unclassified Roseibium]|uniref:hypothetical protein n=1 Tax=unclassified Roseibium TaxID=2629323 RepID=UPI00273D099D|nr:MULTISPECIES: hypothetical protein [unclassified Roseibium]